MHLIFQVLYKCHSLDNTENDSKLFAFWQQYLKIYSQVQLNDLCYVQRCTEDMEVLTGLYYLKANTIRDNRNFQSTENKKYLEDGALNRINANWKINACIPWGGEGLLKGKTRTLSNTSKQLMDDLQINFYNDNRRTNKRVSCVFYFTHIKIANDCLG